MSVLMFLHLYIVIIIEELFETFMCIHIHWYIVIYWATKWYLYTSYTFRPKQTHWLCTIPSKTFFNAIKSTIGCTTFHTATLFTNIIATQWLTTKSIKTLSLQTKMFHEKNSVQYFDRLNWWSPSLPLPRSLQHKYIYEDHIDHSTVIHFECTLTTTITLIWTINKNQF